MQTITREQRLAKLLSMAARRVSQPARTAKQRAIDQALLNYLAQEHKRLAASTD